LGGKLMFGGGVLPAQYCPCGICTVAKRKMSLDLFAKGSITVNGSYRPTLPNTGNS